MIAQNLSEAHERAASGEMPKMIIDGFEAVHVQKHDAERPLRAPRTVKLRFQNADEAPVIGKPGERIAHGHGTHLFEKTCLIQQRPGEHYDVAECLAQLRQEERAVEELPRKRCRSVA